MVKKSAKMGNMYLETMPEGEGGWILSRFLFLFSVLLSLLFLAVVAVGGGLLWVFWTYGKDLPDYHQLAEYEPPVVTRIHAGDGALLAEFANQKRLFVPVEAMPPRLIHAFLSAEDSGFYSHFGIDPQAMLRGGDTNAKNWPGPASHWRVNNYPAGDEEFSSDQRSIFERKIGGHPVVADGACLYKDRILGTLSE